MGREGLAALAEALLVVLACRPELAWEALRTEGSSEPSMDARNTRSRSERRPFSCCSAVAVLCSMPFFLVRSAMTAR